MARLNLKIDNEMSDTLNDLRVRYHLKDEAEVFRIAMKLFKMVDVVNNEGGEVLVKRNGKERKVIV